MKELVKGIGRFHQKAGEIRPLMSRLAEEGQSPRALFLTCVDSRLDPMMFTDAKPGDLLVHRNVGSVVPRYDTGDGSLGAVIEFALTALNIPNIVVMGHSHCGAMKAALDPNFPYGQLTRWLDHVEPARRRFQEGERLDDESISGADQLSQVNVLQSIEHLGQYPVVRERLDRMAVTLHGWWFHLPTAMISAYDPRTHRFLPVEEVYVEGVQVSPAAQADIL